MNDFSKETMLRYYEVGQHASTEEWIEQFYLGEEVPWLEICDDIITYLQMTRDGYKLTLDSEVDTINDEIEKGFALGFAIQKEFYENWSKYPLDQETIRFATTLLEHEIIQVLESEEAAADQSHAFDVIHAQGSYSCEPQFKEFVDEVSDNASSILEFRNEFLLGAFASGRLFYYARRAVEMEAFEDIDKKFKEELSAEAEEAKKIDETFNKLVDGKLSDVFKDSD